MALHARPTTARSASPARPRSISRRPRRDLPITTLDNPFPAGLLAAGRQLARPAHRRRRQHQLHRPEQGRAERPPGTRSTSSASCPGDMALTIGYMGATGRDLGFAGTNNVAPQHQPDRSGCGARSVPGGRAADGTRRRCDRRCPIRSSASPQAGEFGDARDDPARPAPAAVPAVRRRQRVRADRGREAAVPRRDVVLDKRLQGWWGGRYSYTWSGPKDNQFGETAPSSANARRRRTSTTSTPNTASATSTRRTASSSRRSSVPDPSTRATGCSAAGPRRRSSSS